MLRPLYLDERGEVQRPLLWVLTVILLAYVGFKVVPTYFSYFMMKTEVRSEAKSAHFNDNLEIRENLLKKAREWSIPIQDRDIVISRWTREIEIKFSYSVDINFLDYYETTLYFDIQTKKPLMQEH